MSLVPASSFAGGAGALAQIADQLLGADAASIDFAGIPATYNHLLVVVTGRTSAANPSNQVQVQLNGDAGANYDRQYLRINGTTVENNFATGQTVAQLFDLPGSTATANYAGGGSFMIPNYTGTVFFKTMTATGGNLEGGTAGQTTLAEAVWKSTAAVNRITLVTAGNYLAGSRATVYGLS